MQLRREIDPSGTEVVVSAEAEAGRVRGCLCINKETGQYEPACKHLIKNLLYEDALRKFFKHKNPLLDERHVEMLVQDKLKEEAIEAFGPLIREESMHISPNGVCRMALVLYVLHLGTHIGTATTKCPDHELPVPNSEGVEGVGS
ncbi:MAG: hypothetical protein KGJ89_02355 [Patescibacteria group bacterium]|nr:hypothetical protein [Patescibacteria group bacterium]MDE2015719.1 hypothetical protein [Patescibacteria group bacterium]MDE2226777.1 hypothetical protein [Patescibacteria group bacterium]